MQIEKNSSRRVIEQNIGIKFSKEFQTAEFQKEHSFIDAIVSRNDIKTILQRY